MVVVLFFLDKGGKQSLSSVVFVILAIFSNVAMHCRASGDGCCWREFESSDFRPLQRSQTGHSPLFSVSLNCTFAAFFSLMLRLHFIVTSVGMYVNHEFTIAVITVIFALYRDFWRLP